MAKENAISRLNWYTSFNRHVKESSKFKSEILVKMADLLEARFANG